MILFSKDYAEQGAIVDTSTRNLSFVKMSLVLNQMNIHNNLFMLSLFDKELKGRDPHNLNDDSEELRLRVGAEAKINPWFFFRECVRITASGSGGVPFGLNRANLALMWNFYNSIDTFLVIPRQCGKSVGTMAIAAQYLYIAGMELQWGMFCKGTKLQNENVDRLKKIRDALPKYLLHQTSADTNNKEGVAYAKLGTKMLTFVAQDDKQAAGDQARGQTHSVQNWDEIAFYNNIDLSFPVATAALNQGGEDARKAGLPSAKILTTTAGDIDDKRGRWSYNQVCDSLRFTEKLYDSEDIDSLMGYLRTNSRNMMMYLEYSYKQIGKTDEWFERVTRGKDEATIQRDYLNMWTHGTSNSIFTKDMIAKIQSSRRDPVVTTSYETLIIKWYDDPEVLKSTERLRNIPYVIGLDTSDNVGRDFTTMCMVNPIDLHVVATFKCNTTNLSFVARAILRLLMEFPRAIFIPERNKIGVVFIDFIFAEMRRDVFDPLTRIYNKYFQEYTRDTIVTNLNYDDGNVRKNFGFTTTKSATSREFLYSTVLMTAMKIMAERLYDAALIDEISGISMKNGRVDHSEKGHDDLLIAYLLALYFILFAANHNLYGISIDEFLSEVDENSGDNVDSDFKAQQSRMKALLIDYKGKLKHASNGVLKQALEREIQKITRVIGDVTVEENNFVSLDKAKNQANIEGQRAMGLDGLDWLQFA